MRSPRRGSLLISRRSFTRKALANRLRWRGDPTGVLPDGYDPNSIASQAIFDFLHGVAADNREPLVSCGPDSPDPSALQHDLNRLVLRHVTRLYHRKENFLLCNANDLPFVPDMDEEFVS